jgi:hypothetical protein
MRSGVMKRLRLKALAEGGSIISRAAPISIRPRVSPKRPLVASGSAFATGRAALFFDVEALMRSRGLRHVIGRQGTRRPGQVVLAALAGRSLLRAL